MRDFVHDCLYARATGYFSSASARVHRPSEPLPFRKMIGEAEYRDTQRALAASSPEGFLTPVEYFHPWYARALGRYVLRDHRRRVKHERHAPPLRVFEIGGGNGTCALGFLSWLREAAPDEYAHASYELVEISAEMAARQRARLEEAGFPPERYAVHNVSALDWPRGAPAPGARAGGHADRSGHCYVLGLEVLDNLPHDLVRWTRGGLEQAVVLDGGGGVLEQAWEPLADEALASAVDALGLGGAHAWRRAAVRTAREHPGLRLLRPMRVGAAFASALSTRNPTAWVPTAASLMLRAVLDAEPAHTMLLADFSWLPPQPGGALLAPVVHSKEGGVTRDRGGRVLEAADGTCDVFFPTDFDALGALYRTAGGAEAESVPSAQLLAEYAELEHTETRSGYNPLLSDFTNTRIFIGRSGARVGPDQAPPSAAGHASSSGDDNR